MRRHRLLHSQRGLTLVEIIFVLIILSVLIGVLLPGLTGGADKARVQLTKIKLQKLQSYLGQYQLQYNLFPSSLGGITGCDEKTGGTCVPIAKEEEVKDAWGTPFVYSAEGNARAYSLKSLGSDAKEGGTAAAGDIVVQGP
jgi:general secretion pathway protein G